MNRIRTTEVSQHAGHRVQLKGWVHNLRQMGGVSFLVLRDGWGIVQAVAEDQAELLPLLEAGLGPETVITLVGDVKAESQAPGGVELHRLAITVLAPVAEPLPVPINKRQLKASLPTLLDHATVANRHPARRAVFRLAAGVMAGFRGTLAARGFTEVQTPKIVASVTESGSNVFRIDYFGQPAYLAQSPQFYKQIMVGVFERVYEVGPVFRAEPHDTTRHVNEYVSLDVEFGFIEDHFTVMAMARDVIAGILETLRTAYAAELALLEARLPGVPEAIPHIHFAAAQELILQRHGVDVRGEPDLSPQDERWLGEWAREVHGSDFLFVTGYPMSKRPFYTHPDPSRPGYSNSFDLLFRGTELITGGQRLHLYADYQAALQRAALPEAPFESYLQAFRYGMPPHGGFAIGLERLLMQLLDAPNLRLITLFPRDMQRVTPWACAGYTHHIERLMLVCNFCLLAGSKPAQVNDWFLSTYVDAYEWGMLPHVLGMGLPAIGVQAATKPYVASAAYYISRMSDYCQGCRYNPKQRTGEDACPFNFLYLNFLRNHEEALRQNPRLGNSVVGLRHLDDAERRRVRGEAERFLQELAPEAGRWS